MESDKPVQNMGNAPPQNPMSGQPLHVMATNQLVITEAKIRRAVSHDCVFITHTVYPDIPRTRLSADEHVRLARLIRSMTDEVEGHLNKIAEDPEKCNADKYAALAIACKQTEFMVRSTLLDVDTPEAKELAQMLRLYDQKKKLNA